MAKTEVIQLGRYSGHQDCVYGLCGGWQEEVFYSCSGDGMIVQWQLTNPDQGQLVAKVANSVYAISKAGTSGRILVGHNFEGVHLIDVEAKTELASAKLTSAAIFDIKVIDNYVWIATGDGELIVVSENNLSVVHKTRISHASLRCISYMLLGDHVAIGSSDNQITIVSKTTFQPICKIQAHQNSVFSVSYSPDEIFLISGSRDARLKIWDVTRSYQLYKTIPAHMFAINDIKYSPDNNYLATASMDKTIKVWDAASFQLIKVIDKARHNSHSTSVNKLYWSSYQNQLISCSDDRSVLAWALNFKDNSE